MRRSIAGIILGAAAAGIGLSSVVESEEQMIERRKREVERAAAKEEGRKAGRKRIYAAPAISGSIAKGNRHGGGEHGHSREIQRRLKQEARRAAKPAGG